jgi:hypothetical protein
VCRGPSAPGLPSALQPPPPWRLLPLNLHLQLLQGPAEWTAIRMPLLSSSYCYSCLLQGPRLLLPLLLYHCCLAAPLSALGALLLLLLLLHPLQPLGTLLLFPDPLPHSSRVVTTGAAGMACCTLLCHPYCCQARCCWLLPLPLPLLLLMHHCYPLAAGPC